MLHQVASDHSLNKEILWVIRNCFYMDDHFYGADTESECRLLINDISATLENGNFNSTLVFQDVKQEKHLESLANLQSGTTIIKTLSLKYSRKRDNFRYEVKQFSDLNYMKNGLLSLCALFMIHQSWKY
mgnify:CR=1 FL=1